MDYKFFFGGKTKKKHIQDNKQDDYPVSGQLLQQARDGYSIDWHDEFLANLECAITPRTGTLSPARCRTLLEQILTWDAKFIENDFYHNHFFVMRFIGERGSFLNDVDFLTNQVENFLDFSWADGKSRSLDGNKHWQRFLDWTAGVHDEMTSRILKKIFFREAENDDGDVWYRASCATALGRLGEKEQAVKLLFRGIEHKTLDVGVRGFCAHSLIEIETGNKATVQRLLNIVEDDKEQEWLRSACADVIAKMKVEDKVILDRLLAIIDNRKQSGWLRGSVAEGIGKLCINDKQAATFLLEIAQDDTQDTWTRRGCSSALIDLGYRDEAIEQLFSIIQDEDMDILIRSAATETIGRSKIADSTVLERVLEITLDDHYDILLRRFAVESVGKLAILSSDRSAHAFAHLLTLIQDESQHGILRGAAAETLGKLGIKDKTATGHLLSLAEDSYQPPLLRRSCIDAVGFTGSKGENVGLRLLTLAADVSQDDLLRGACLNVLGKLGIRDDRVLEFLLSFVQDEQKDITIRRTCARTLGLFGWCDLALDTLVSIYTTLSVKTNDDARSVYDTLWELTTRPGSGGQDSPAH